jgi:drug/metabolite transporter (DMT)-like permease
MNLLMPTAKTARLIAVSECVLFTLIAGSTLVFAKMALDYLGPLTLTGLRYFLAFLLLLPFMFHHSRVTRLSPQLWFRFFLIGLSFYVVGNGALFWGLKYIPATTASLVLNFIPLLVLIAGIFWLNEIPTRLQVVGVIVAVIGGILFFSPGLKVGEPLGIAVVAIGPVGNAVFGILGREIAREQKVDTLTLTAVPLALGSSILILIALSIEGLPRFSVTGWGMVLGLAVVNTACAVVLYNHALTVLPAFELSAILNLTPLMTATWAWLFLSERLSLVQIVGMVTVIIGVLVVQLGKKHAISAHPALAADAASAALRRRG